MTTIALIIYAAGLPVLWYHKYCTVLEARAVQLASALRHLLRHETYPRLGQHRGNLEIDWSGSRSGSRRCLLPDWNCGSPIVLRQASCQVASRLHQADGEGEQHFCRRATAVRTGERRARPRALSCQKGNERAAHVSEPVAHRLRSARRLTSGSSGPGARAACPSAAEPER